MPLTGTRSKPSPAKPRNSRAELNAILDQLDHEWETLKQGDPAHHGEDSGLLAYYHTCTRSLLQDIRDPYGRIWPAEYRAASRIPAMCDWLNKLLHESDKVKVKEARELMLKNLRLSWPAYRDLDPPDVPDGLDILALECPPYSFQALVSHWPGETHPEDTETYPHFSCRAVADFNLAALALLLLNKQLKWRLTDLHSHPTDIDGIPRQEGKNNV